MFGVSTSGVGAVSGVNVSVVFEVLTLMRSGVGSTACGDDKTSSSGIISKSVEMILCRPGISKGSSNEVSSSVDACVVLGMLGVVPGSCSKGSVLEAFMFRAVVRLGVHPSLSLIGLVSFHSAIPNLMILVKASSSCAALGSRLIIML